MELNLIAYDKENRIISSYVLPIISVEDLENNFPKNEENIFLFSQDFMKELEKLYEIFTKRVSPSEKYDIRLKRTIISKVLSEISSSDEIEEKYYFYKEKCKFNPRKDVQTEYKFFMEMINLKNILQFCETYKDYNLGIAYIKYEG